MLERTNPIDELGNAWYCGGVSARGYSLHCRARKSSQWPRCSGIRFLTRQVPATRVRRMPPGERQVWHKRGRLHVECSARQLRRDVEHARQALKSRQH